MKLTYRKLKLAGACTEQAELFRELFPKGVTVTAAVCRSVADKFDWNSWDWAAANFLPAQLQAEYDHRAALLRAEYARLRDPLLAEYNRAALLRAEYVRLRDPLLAEYNLQAAPLSAPLWAEYDRRVAPLRAEYDGQRAQLFGRLAEDVD